MKKIKVSFIHGIGMLICKHQLSLQNKDLSTNILMKWYIYSLLIVSKNLFLYAIYKGREKVICNNIFSEYNKLSGALRSSVTILLAPLKLLVNKTRSLQYIFIIIPD